MSAFSLSKAAPILSAMFPEEDTSDSPVDETIHAASPAQQGTTGPISDDQAKAYLRNLLDEANGGLPLPGLAAIVVDHIFGTKLDDPREDLFLTHTLDPTDDIQADFNAKISEMLTRHGYADPTSITVHVYRRKAGFNGRITTTEDFGLITPYLVGMCLKDFVEVTSNNQSFVFQSGQISPLFEMAPASVQPKKKKTTAKYSSKVELTFQGPYVKRNQTQVTLSVPGQKERSTVKARDYLAIMVWIFWEDYPIAKSRAEQEANTDTTSIKESMESIKNALDNPNTALGQEIKKLLTPEEMLALCPDLYQL